MTVNCKIKRILFYAPYDGRARDVESIILEFHRRGFEVFFYSQLKGEIVDFLKEKGIKAFSPPNLSRSVFLRIFQLIKFCYKHNIDVVFSHLEPAHFPAVISQFFIKAKLYVCRHHVDEMHLARKNRLLSYRMTYLLGKRFIVVSKKAKEFMIEVEKIKGDKIRVINLAYDFSLYNKVNKENALKIRQGFKCDLLLITACRLVKDKRPELSLEVVEKLRRGGFNVKLIILGGGYLEGMLKGMIVERGLINHCFLLGRKNNILDYIDAADILLHPSILDSSSVIVKEAGLVKKPVIVCGGVGDFDDYIKHEKNGFIVSKEDFVDDAVEVISKFTSQMDVYSEIGKNLHEDVHRLFGIKNVFPQYEQITKRIG